MHLFGLSIPFINSGTLLGFPPSGSPVHQFLPSPEYPASTFPTESLSFVLFCFVLFCFVLFVVVVVVAAISWAAPAAYGGSQARG